MKPIIYWIEEAAWRKAGQGTLEKLNLRRGRLRVQKPDATVYFYLEDASQMGSIYEIGSGKKRQIDLRLRLRDLKEAQMVSGVPQSKAPPFHDPPFHLKMQFPFEMLSIADEVDE